MRRHHFVAIWISLSLLEAPTSNALQISGPIQKGYIRLQSDTGTTPAGVAIIGWRHNNFLATEATIPSTTPIQSGRIFAEVEGPVNTGLTLVNPNNQDVTISYYFVDSLGNDFGAGSFTLMAHHQLDAFLNEEPFRLSSSLVGTFTFTSSAPVAAVALRRIVNQRNERLIATTPVSPLDEGLGGSALLIPHLGGGANVTTQIVLVNPRDKELAGTIQFSGTKSKNLVNSTLEYTIPPRGVFRMTRKPAVHNPEVSLVRIKPAPTSAAPSSFAILSSEQGDITVSTTSIAALPMAKAFRTYVETSGVVGENGAIQTGVAIWNPDDGPVSVQLEMTNLEGKPIGISTSVELHPGGQINRSVNELFPQLPLSFKGVLKITSPSPLAVSAMRGVYNQRCDLLMTELPPYTESALPVSEKIFPHFVSGGGYFTQLILWSTGSAQKGSLSLLSEEGTPLPGSNLQPNP
jgi:hypothetical protein